MRVRLPRDIYVDIDNVPENLEEIIQKSFGEFTEMTAEAYTFEDKLYYIDLCLHCLHREADADDEIMEFMKERFEYEIKEYGDIPDRDDYLSFDFMEDCYNLGKRKHELYSKDFAEDRRDNEKIEKLLIRVIKAVMDYPEEGK